MEGSDSGEDEGERNHSSEWLTSVIRPNRCVSSNSVDEESTHLQSPRVSGVGSTTVTAPGEEGEDEDEEDDWEALLFRHRRPPSSSRSRSSSSRSTKGSSNASHSGASHKSGTSSQSRVSNYSSSRNNERPSTMMFTSCTPASSPSLQSSASSTSHSQSTGTTHTSKSRSRRTNAAHRAANNSAAHTTTLSSLRWCPASSTSTPQSETGSPQTLSLQTSMPTQPLVAFPTFGMQGRESVMLPSRRAPWEADSYDEDDGDAAKSIASFTVQEKRRFDAAAKEPPQQEFAGYTPSMAPISLVFRCSPVRSAQSQRMDRSAHAQSTQSSGAASSPPRSRPPLAPTVKSLRAENSGPGLSSEDPAVKYPRIDRIPFLSVADDGESVRSHSNSEDGVAVSKDAAMPQVQAAWRRVGDTQFLPQGSGGKMALPPSFLQASLFWPTPVSASSPGKGASTQRSKGKQSGADSERSPKPTSHSEGGDSWHSTSSAGKGGAAHREHDESERMNAAGKSYPVDMGGGDDVFVELETREEGGTGPVVSILRTGQPGTTSRSWVNDDADVTPRLSDVSSSSSSSSLLPSVSSVSTWMSVSNSTVHARHSMFDLSLEGNVSATASETHSAAKRPDSCNSSIIFRRGDLNARNTNDCFISADPPSSFIAQAADGAHGPPIQRQSTAVMLEKNDTSLTPREGKRRSECKETVRTRNSSFYEDSEQLDPQPSFFSVSLPSSRTRKDTRGWKSRELFSPFNTIPPDTGDGAHPLVSWQSDSSDSTRSSARDQHQSNRQALGTSPLVIHTSQMPPMWITSADPVAARSHRSTGSGRNWKDVSKTKTWIRRLLGRRQRHGSTSTPAGMVQLQFPDAFQEFTPLHSQRSHSRTISPLLVLSPLTASMAADDQGQVCHVSDPARSSQTTSVASGTNGDETRRVGRSLRWISPLLSSLRARHRALPSSTPDTRTNEPPNSSLDAPLLFSNGDMYAETNVPPHTPVVYLAYSTANGVAHRQVSMATILSRLSQWHTQQEKEKEAMRYILGVAQLLFVPDAIQEEEVELRHYISNINKLRHYAALPLPLPSNSAGIEADPFTIGKSLANVEQSGEASNNTIQTLDSMPAASTADTMNHSSSSSTPRIRVRERRARTIRPSPAAAVPTNESIVADSSDSYDRENMRLLQRAEESLEEISALLKAKREKHARRIASMKTFSVLLSMFLPTATLLGVSLLTSAVAVSGSIVLVMVGATAALSHWISVRCFHMCFSMNRWPSVTRGSGFGSPANGRHGEGNGWLLTNSSLLCLAEWSGGAALRRTLLFLMCGTYLTCAVLLLCVGSALLSGGIQMQHFLVDFNLMDRVPTQDLTPSSSDNGARNRYKSNDIQREKGLYGVDPCVFDSRNHVVSYAPIILAFLCLPQPPLGGWLKYMRYWDTQLFRVVTLGVLVISALHVVLTHVVYVLSSGRMVMANAAMEFPFLIWRDSFGHGLSWMRDNESALVALFRALRGRDAYSSTEGNTSASDPETFTLSSVVSFLLLHFSLSTAAVAWLLVPSVFIVRSGTYHLFMVPLLWRLGNRTPPPQQQGPTSEDRNSPPYSRETAGDPSTSASDSTAERSHSGTGPQGAHRRDKSPLLQREGQGTPVAAGDEKNDAHDASVSPFYATGFGYRFRVGFALLIVAAVLCAALLLVDTTANSQAFAAPLPLRLLWTATPTMDSTSKEVVEVCSLGNQYNHPVVVMRFTALTAFLFGLVLCAWVPYFITSASSLIAQEGTGSHPRLTSTTVANSVWSTFMQRIRPTHREPAPPSCSNSQPQPQPSNTTPTPPPDNLNRSTETKPDVVVIHPVPETLPSQRTRSSNAPVTPEQLYQIPKREQRAPSRTHSALQRCLKPLTMLKRAVGRGGGNTGPPESTAASSSIIRLDSVSSIFQFFQSLRCSAATLHQQITVAFLAELFLLRFPFLILTLLLSALVLSGKTARCYAYWEFWNMGKSWTVDNALNPECADISTKIAAPLFGRIFLVAALGGGFFLAPILFHVMPFIVYRDALQRYVHCVELKNTATEASNTYPDVSVAAESQSRDENESELVRPSLTPSEVECGVEGMQHFVSIQGGPNTTISSRLERRYSDQRDDGYVRADEHEMVFSPPESRGGGRAAFDGVRRRHTSAQPFAVRALMLSQANRTTRVIPSVVHRSPLTVHLQQRWHRQQAEDATHALERKHLLNQLSRTGPSFRTSADVFAINRASHETSTLQRVEAALRSLDSKERRTRRRRFAVSFARTAMYTCLMLAAHLIGCFAFLGALRACDALFLQLRAHNDV